LAANQSLFQTASFEASAYLQRSRKASKTPWIWRTLTICECGES
jgi:hypothetical protein